MRGEKWGLALKDDVKKQVQATEFVNTLTLVEEPFAKQAALAMIWAGTVYLALGPVTSATWLCLILAGIFLPRLPKFRNKIKRKPYGLVSQFFGVVTAAIWGIAPFMVWTLGEGSYGYLAITMIGIGFLQVINQYRSEPRPAFLVAVPYLMLIGWFLYQSRMSTTFIIALMITLAYLMTLLGFVWAGQKTKKSIVAYKVNQDKLQLKLEVARDEAENASHAKSMFLANMSHELRTPLNGILGLSDVLKSELLDKNQMRKINLIHDSGENLLSLLNDILDISKIEAEGVALEKMDINLHDVLQKAFAFWKPVADQKKIEFVFQKQKGLQSHLVADPTRIRQCLNNLINNALKFTPESGRVVITAKGRQTDNGYALAISVQDTGIGLSQESIGKLFNPFVQADEGTTRKYGGSGLGLAITRKLCRLMGGDVTVQSILGKGSVFRMSLMTANAEAQTVAPISIDASPLLSSGFKGKRCLVVEDNEINLEVLMLLLEPYQLDIVTSSNGREAIDVLETQFIDFVLMDSQMPVLGGLEATEIIRRGNTPYANVPIIAMTANAMPGDKTKCLNAGMDGYVSKPLSRSTLVEAISKATNFEANAAESVA